MDCRVALRRILHTLPQRKLNAKKNFGGGGWRLLTFFSGILACKNQQYTTSSVFYACFRKLLLTFGDTRVEIRIGLFLEWGYGDIRLLLWTYLFGFSMKAITAPRLPRPICRARKPIFVDHKQVYISIFCFKFFIFYYSSFKIK